MLDVDHWAEIAYDWDLNGFLVLMDDNGKYKVMIGMK